MRAFVAVEVGDEGVLRGIREMQREAGAGARPVAAENMHFTLRFLGEISEAAAGEAASALEAVSFRPFEVVISGAGAFPSPRAPRAVWVGTDPAGGESMGRLARSVGAALGPPGAGRGGRFVPHLTVFRIKSRQRDMTGELQRFGGRVFGTITVSEIKLKRSVLGPSGPAYSDLGAVRAG